MHTHFKFGLTSVISYISVWEYWNMNWGMIVKTCHADLKERIWSKKRSKRKKNKKLKFWNIKRWLNKNTRLNLYSCTYDPSRLSLKEKLLWNLEKLGGSLWVENKQNKVQKIPIFIFLHCQARICSKEDAKIENSLVHKYESL